MNKISLLALAATAALLAFSGVTFAQESVTVPSTMVPKNIRALIQDTRVQRAGVKAAAQVSKENVQKKAVDLRQSTKNAMTAATSSAERRAIEKNAIEERKGIISERQASTTAMKEQLNMLARQHVGAIEQRYAIAIKQFENLAGRIQSRITKMKAGGTDTTSAETALSLAQAAIAQVKTDAQALADVSAQVSSGDAKVLRTRVEAAVKNVNASVKAAHSALEKAGKALTEGIRTQKTGATSSASATVTN